MSPQVRNAIAAAAIYIAAVGLAWKLTGRIDPVQVVIVIGFIWFLGLNVARNERDEETRADVDETARDVDQIREDLADLDTIRSDLWAIKEDLTGNTASAGRHAPPQQRKPSPRPRSVA